MLSTPVIYIEENRSKLRHGTTYAYGLKENAKYFVKENGKYFVKDKGR